MNSKNPQIVDTGRFWPLLACLCFVVVYAQCGRNPAHLFKLMHDIVVAQPEWETRLAPRILLGLWHPSFIKHAKEHLPYCRRSQIGGDLELSRRYFWDHVDAFSVWFGALTTADGEKCVCAASPLRG